MTLRKLRVLGAVLAAPLGIRAATVPRPPSVTRIEALTAEPASALAMRGVAPADSDTTWVRPPNIAPALDAVEMRGDSVFFVGDRSDRPYGFASIAYVYDRRRGTFARVARRAWLDSLPPLSGTIGGASWGSWCGEAEESDGARSFRLTDSLDLVAVRLPDDRMSCMLRIAGHRTIDLRVARIAVERRWRVRHHLPATPVADSEVPFTNPSGPRASTWAPLEAAAFALDSQAIWIGLASDRAQYGEFALGGIVRVDRRTLAVSFPDTVLLHASVAQLVPMSAGYVIVASGSFVADGGPEPSPEGDTGRLYRLRSSDARVTPLRLPSARAVAVANDTAWVAGAGVIAALDLRTGRSRSRGFRLAPLGDSLVYELADSTVAPSWSFLGAAGLATDYIHGSGVARPGALVRASPPYIRAVALEYYVRGDRVYVTIPLDHDTVNDSTLDALGYSRDDLDGPAMIGIEGATSPAMRALMRTPH